MHLINKIYDKAMEELEEAECYAGIALELKNTKPDVASKLMRLSEEEMSQAEALNSIVLALYEEKKRENVLTDRDSVKHEFMQERYHKSRAEARTIQAAYKLE